MKPGATGILALPFKDARDYLHSTDLFDALLALLAPSEAAPLLDVELELHRPARTQVQYCVDRGGGLGRPPSDTCAVLRGLQDTVPTRIVLRETGVPITECYRSCEP